MATKADSDELRQAFEHHLKETEGQVERLEQIFSLCGLKPSAKTCPAIKGILEEGEEDMKEAKEPVVLDASMIADAQAVEHYEIARYGTLIAWANQLGMSDAARLLQQTIDQEYNADMLLTDLAEGRLNRQAALLRTTPTVFKNGSAGRLARVVAICAMKLAGRRSPA
jgi:ferritin-like metal-binding protein YciE